MSRIFELRSEVQTFLANSKFDLKDRFSDNLWLCRLAYLADIFDRLNQLNSSLQGSSITPFTVVDKVKATVKKLEFMKNDLDRARIDSFPSLEEFMSESKSTLHPDLILDIKQHCSQLIVNFQKYFPENYSTENWIRDPFSSEQNFPNDFSIQEREQLIELSCDSGLETKFKFKNLSNFWLKRRHEYPMISDKALKFLIPFSTSYLCETGFSAMLAIKNKYRTKLDLEPSLRLKLTKILPNIKKLCSMKQPQPSH